MDHEVMGIRGLRGQHAQGQVRSSFRMRTDQRYIRGVTHP